MDLQNTSIPPARGTYSELHVGDVTCLYVCGYVQCQFTLEPNGTSDLILTPQILHSTIAELGKLEGHRHVLRTNTAPIFTARVPVLSQLEFLMSKTSTRVLLAVDLLRLVCDTELA